MLMMIILMYKWIEKKLNYPLIHAIKASAIYL